MSGTGTSQTEGSATRQRVLAEARILFLKRGYDATPMSVVAKASGVTTPALYWHFASKDELFFEVIRREYESMLDVVVNASCEGSPEERLHAYVKTFVMLKLQDLSLVYGFAQLRAALPPERRAEVAALERQYVGWLYEILDDGQRAGTFRVTDHKVAARAISTMCEYVFLWFKHGGRYSPAEVGDMYAEFALAIARGANGGPGA